MTNQTTININNGYFMTNQTTNFVKLESAKDAAVLLGLGCIGASVAVLLSRSRLMTHLFRGAVLLSQALFVNPETSLTIIGATAYAASRNPESLAGWGNGKICLAALTALGVSKAYSFSCRYGGSDIAVEAALSAVISAVGIGVLTRIGNAAVNK